ncbi:hypothetical protein U8557_002748 [Salmonella enterica]|nr:hypothetical protein [Salmonella enterica]EGP9458766.1 hypothetical protein [Salmonella enterica]EKP7536925.1 hypothetical protein [Salmonella enterica]EKQ2080666.1 hypothetical protein [Salmonella enterica]ELM5539945.1 hypothetical protein [Salmonella enterica]
MSDNRESQVNQNVISELTALLRQHADDAHEALNILAVVAHSLMQSCAAKSFETREIGGEGMRFTRLFSDPQSKPTERSEPPTETPLH